MTAGASKAPQPAFTTSGGTRWSRFGTVDGKALPGLHPTTMIAIPAVVGMTIAMLHPTHPGQSSACWQSFHPGYGNCRMPVVVSYTQSTGRVISLRIGRYQCTPKTTIGSHAEDAHLIWKPPTLQDEKWQQRKGRLLISR